MFTYVLGEGQATLYICNISCLYTIFFSNIWSLSLQNGCLWKYVSSFLSGEVAIPLWFLISLLLHIIKLVSNFHQPRGVEQNPMLFFSVSFIQMDPNVLRVIHLIA